MAAAPYKVLFICTDNAARSIIAECLLNQLGEGRFKAHSAGTFPREFVHPLALELLSRGGYDTSKLRPKSWDEFATPDAPRLDFVFTVCDDAASEVCPVWSGQPMTTHWGLPDPATVIGSEARRAFAFAVTLEALTERVAALVDLPIESLDRAELKARLEWIAVRHQ